MAQFGQPTYEIERPTGRCALTGRALEPGEPYVATLVELEAEEADAARGGRAALGLRRLDVSWEAWSDGRRPPRLYCHWKTTVAQPNQRKRLFVDDDVLMNLFRRLADDRQPQRIAFRFVLGLILMRKKCLRYDGTERRERCDAQDQRQVEDWWLVTAKLDLSKGPLGRWNDEDRLEMLDPHPDDAQIQQVTEQLSEVLEAEL